MKTRNLLLALGCAAAFTACTNNDEPAVAPAMRTVTLSVEVAEPADTRVAYTEDGTTYKFAWAEGDKLRMFYKNSSNEEKYADFTVDATTISGGKADFTGTLPDDFSGTVTIGYCDKNYFGGPDYNMASYNGESITETYPLENRLANRTLLYAEDVVVTGGTLPNVKLQHAYAYLLLKSGLEVTNASKTVKSGDTEMYLVIGGNPGWIFRSNGMSIRAGQNGTQVRDVYVTDGKLIRDYLVPIIVGKEGGDAIELNTYAEQSGTKSTAVTQPAHAYVPGKIYEVAADNTHWKATLFE